MTRRRTYSKREMIAMTNETVHHFYDRKPAELTKRMDDNFAWIGAYDFQWTESLHRFVEATRSELAENPVTITDEEYHVLFNDRNVWILYGRYTASATMPDNKIIQAHVRCTYVWRQMGDEMRLLHIHGSNAADYPPPETQVGPDDSFFAYVRSMTALKEQDTCSYRDTDGNFHCLHPAEIVYIKAADQYCNIVTHSGEITIRSAISALETSFPLFIRTQRSYLVNPTAVMSIRRYRATLYDGTELPISQDRYMTVKKSLK